MNDCLFCKIVRGETPSTIVYHDEQVTAFRDTNPKAPVHILIVPNRHIASVDALAPADEVVAGHIFLVAQALARQEGLVPGGYRLVANTGPAAGQSVQHLHVHLLGGRRLGWPPG